MKQFVTLLISVILSATMWASERQYERDVLLPADSLHLLLSPDNIKSANYEVRASLSRNSEQQGDSKEFWRIIWNYTDTNNYCYVTFRCANSDYGDFADQRYARITVGCIKNGIDSLILKKNITKDINTSLGENSLMIECTERQTRIFAGNKKYQMVASLDECRIVGGTYCGVLSNADLKIRSMVLDCQKDVKTELMTQWTADSLLSHIQNADDGIVGIWGYLDRDNNSDKARLGGRYKLAIVKSGVGYDLIYLSDAVTNQSQWKSGMIKGRLVPTIFENHYDLVWYDSMFEVIDTDAYADIEDKSVLSLQFPLYETTIRMSKGALDCHLIESLFQK